MAGNLPNLIETQIAAYHPDSSWLEAINLLLIRPLTQLNDSISNSNIEQQKQQQKPSYTNYDYELCTIESDACAANETFVKIATKNDDDDDLPDSSIQFRRNFPFALLRVEDFSPEWRSILGEDLIARYESPAGSIIENHETDSIAPILSDRDNITRKLASKVYVTSGAEKGDEKGDENGDEIGDKKGDEKGHTEPRILSCSVALRICAIRAAYQQLGILLTEPRLINIDEQRFRNCDIPEQPINDGENFIELFRQKKANRIRPRIESLYEWSNWLTPSTVGRSPRYDTLHYLCSIDETDLWPVNLLGSSGPPPPSRAIVWSPVDRFLSGYGSKSANGFLASPSTIYECARLADYHRRRELTNFAAKREFRFHIRRWLPSIALYNDGTVSFLPGDRLYPRRVPVLPGKTPRLYDRFRVEDMRTKTLNIKTNEDDNDRKSIANNHINRFEHFGRLFRIVIGGEHKMATEETFFGHSPIRHNHFPVIRLPNCEVDYYGSPPLVSPIILAKL